MTAGGIAEQYTGLGEAHAHSQLTKTVPNGTGQDNGFLVRCSGQEAVELWWKLPGRKEGFGGDLRDLEGGIALSQLMRPIEFLL